MSVEQKYIVKLLSPLSGSYLQDVVSEASPRLGLAPDKVTALLTRGSGPITKPAAREVSARVVQILREAGAEVELVQRNWDDFLLADGNPAPGSDASQFEVWADDDAWPDDVTESDLSEPEQAASETSSSPPPARRAYLPLLLGGVLVLVLVAAIVPGLRARLSNFFMPPRPQVSEPVTVPEDSPLSADALPEPASDTPLVSGAGADGTLEPQTTLPDESSTLPEPFTDLGERAEAGEPGAQLELARRYTAGDGLPQDNSLAFAWLGRAAEAGEAEAQYELGWHYANGIGTERDLSAAARWYEEAALSGNPEAQYQLGFYRYYGQGAAQDLVEARRWFLAAAEAGVVEAQFRIGVMLIEGQGGAADLAEAERWLQLALEQGVTEAEPYLTALVATDQVAAEAAPSAPPSTSDVSTPSVPSEAAQQVDTADLNEPAEPVAQGDEVAGAQLSAPGVTPLVNSATPTPTSTTEVPAAVVTTSSTASVSRSATNGFQGGAVRLSANTVPARPVLTEEDKRLFDAARSGDAATIAATIRAGADVNARDAYGQTPLMYAASHNRTTAIAELIVDLAEVNAQSDAGWTALMYAARDNPDVVEALLVRGADPTIVNADAQTALDIALAAGTQAVERLQAALPAPTEESAPLPATQPGNEPGTVPTPEAREG